MITKPMLAAKLTDFSKIQYPVLATPKIDGIRCLIIDGEAVSRTFKPIPNLYVRETLKGLPSGLDGELVVGENFQETSSGVMSIHGEPNFIYMVFDWFRGEHSQINTYFSRTEDLRFIALPEFCTKLLPERLNNEEELLKYEQWYLQSGYEGICIRTPNSPYKCGRSTEKEGYLIKIKRFQDSEAVIYGLEEQMENQNKLVKNEIGYAKRATYQEHKIGKNTLGAFLVREIGDTPWYGKEFKIGTGVGLTNKLRQTIWDNPKEFLGEIITYKYQPHGIKDLPRIPVFKGFRKEK